MSATTPKTMKLNDLFQIARERLTEGKLEDAESICRAILKAKANQADTLNLLGVVLMRQEKYQEAHDAFAAAVAERPGLAEAWENLGLLGRYLKQMSHEDAEKPMQDYLRHNPDDVNALTALGLCRLTRTLNHQAMEPLEKAHSLDPEAMLPLLHYATALSNASYYKESLPLWHQYNEKCPEDNTALLFLADGYGELSEREKAKEYYLKVIAANDAAEEPDPNLYTRAGQGLNTINEKELAEETLKRALDLNPDNATAALNLFALREPQEDSPEYRAIKGRLDRLDELEEREQQEVYAALGEYHHHRKEYDEAFKCFEKQNEIYLRIRKYDKERPLQELEKTMEMITPELIERLQGNGDPTTQPIFITGIPRSGTTMTEQILVRHPKIAAGGERPTLGIMLRNVADEDGNHLPYPEKLLGALQGGDCTTFGATYANALRRAFPEAQYVTDKMPGNVHHLPLIHLFMPNAKLIFCKRNPMDVALSSFQANFAGYHPWAADLETAGRYCRLTLDMMAKWDELLPGKILTVVYEDIVADLETNVRRMLDFIGIEFDDACLAPQESEARVRTASIRQVRNPVYTTSVERWRRYEKHLQPLIDALGPYGPKD